MVQVTSDDPEVATSTWDRIDMITCQVDTGASTLASPAQRALAMTKLLWQLSQQSCKSTRETLFRLSQARVSDALQVSATCDQWNADNAALLQEGGARAAVARGARAAMEDERDRAWLDAKRTCAVVHFFTAVAWKQKVSQSQSMALTKLVKSIKAYPDGDAAATCALHVLLQRTRSEQ